MKASRTFKLFPSVLRAILPIVGFAAVSEGWTTPFRNLDFESAIEPLPPPSVNEGRVSIDQGLPGWSAYFGDSLQPIIFHNSIALSEASIAVLGPGPGVQHPIDGNYVAYLGSGLVRVGSSYELRDASIAQVGDVPVGTRSIQMKIFRVGGGPFRVSLGGEVLSMVSLLVEPNATLYGANIDGFAGRTTELRITAVENSVPPRLLPTRVYLDSIAFSPNSVIPEPNTMVLLALAALSGLWFARYSRRHKG